MDQAIPDGVLEGKDIEWKYVDRRSQASDVLQWWKKQVDVPLLSALAKNLSIPATSVSSERVFSTAGDSVTAQRSLPHPDHVDQLKN